MHSWEIVSRYTRAEAIADGELIDISSVGKLIGFVYPIALTRAVYYDVVRLPEPGSSARLFNFVRFLKERAKASSGESLVELEVNGKKLFMECGAGDDGEPVLTVYEDGER